MKNDYLLKKASQDSQLPRSAFVVLLNLIMLKQPWTKNQQTLANIIGIERSVLNQALGSLERGGYIKRIEMAGNGFVKPKKIILLNE